MAGPQRPACGLVSTADIEASLAGAKVAAGRESVDDARSVCFYPLAATGEQGVIITSTTSPGAGAAFAKVRDNLGPAAQPLDAGDQAFVAGAQAAVLKGTTLVAVLVTARPSPAGAAATVAQAAAAHL